MAEENLESQSEANVEAEQNTTDDVSESKTEENPNGESAETKELAKQEEESEEKKRQIADAAWKRLRKESTAAKRKQKELEDQLAEYKSKLDSFTKESSYQPNFSQQNQQQPQNFAVLYDPVTGKQLPLNMTFEELERLGSNSQNQFQGQQKPVETKKQDTSTSNIEWSQDTKAQALDSVKRNGIDVQTTLVELFDMGLLDTHLTEAAAQIASEFGENGIDFLYEIGRTRSGQEKLDEIARKDNPAKRIAAMTKLMSDMAARKQSKLHSNSTKQPTPLKENGSFAKGAFTAAEAYEKRRRGEPVDY